MTLESLIVFLAREDYKQEVQFGFSHPHSYRGDYCQVAFKPKNNTTVGEMLSEARSALDNTYNGYKGGEYVMHGYVECYLAYHGDCGEQIGPYLLEFMLGRTPSAVVP